jgi:hypothetical protein
LPALALKLGDRPREVLRPPRRLNVIDEVIGAFRQVDKIGISQIDEPLVRMFLSSAAVERSTASYLLAQVSTLTKVQPILCQCVALLSMTRQ